MDLNCDEIVRRVLETLVTDPCDPYNGGIDCGALIQDVVDSIGSVDPPPDPCDPYNGGVDCNRLIQEALETLAYDPCDPYNGGYDCNAIVQDVLELLFTDPCDPYNGGINCQGIIDSLAQLIPNVCPNGPVACVDPYITLVGSLVDDLYYDVCGGDLSYCSAKYQQIVQDLIDGLVIRICSGGLETCDDLVISLVNFVGQIIDDLYYDICGGDLSYCQAKYQQLLQDVIDGVVIKICTGGTSTCDEMIVGIVNGAVAEASRIVDDLYYDVCGGDLSYCQAKYQAIVQALIDSVVIKICSGGLSTCDDVIIAIVSKTIDDAYYTLCGPNDLSGCQAKYNDLIDGLFESVCTSSTSSGSQACVDMITKTINDTIAKACPPTTSGTGPFACVDLAAELAGYAVDTVGTTLCPNTWGSAGMCAGEVSDRINKVVSDAANVLCQSTTSSGVQACIDMVNKTLDETVDRACPPTVSSSGAEACVELVQGLLADAVDLVFTTACPGYLTVDECTQEHVQELSLLLTQKLNEVVALACPFDVDATACVQRYVTAVTALADNLVETVCPGLECPGQTIESVAYLVGSLIATRCPTGLLTCGDPYIAGVETLLTEFIEANCPELSCPERTVDNLIALGSGVVQMICGPASLGSCQSTLENLVNDLIQTYCPGLACGDYLLAEIEAIVNMLVTGTCPAGLAGCVDGALHDCPSPPYIAQNLPPVLPPRCGLAMIGSVIKDFRVGAEVPTPGAGLRAEAMTSDGFTEFEILTTGHGAVFLFKVGDEGVTTEIDPTPDLVPPQAPSDAAAVPVSSSRISLTWSDNSTDESGFRIERATSQDGPFSVVATLDEDITSFVDGSLEPETTYAYRVSAFNTAGNSAPSNVATATTMALPPAPSAPSSLTATATSPSEIDLAWVDSSDTEDGFTLERSDDGGASFDRIHSAPAGATSYRDTGLLAGQSYSYRVVAYNDGGASSPSNIASATTPTPPPAPAPPTSPSNATVAVWSSDSLKLTWSDNSADEDGFVVEGSGSSAGPWTRLTSVGSNKTAYVESGLGAGVTRWYRVKAFNGAGDSSYSNTASGTTPSAPSSTPTTPSAPSDLYVWTASESQLRLTWVDRASNEDGFTVQRATSSTGPFSAVGSTAPNSQQFTDSYLQPNTTYFYRVSAFNSAGNSSNSNIASARTADPAVPSEDEENGTGAFAGGGSGGGGPEKPCEDDAHNFLKNEYGAQWHLASRETWYYNKSSTPSYLVKDAVEARLRAAGQHWTAVETPCKGFSDFMSSRQEGLIYGGNTDKVNHVKGGDERDEAACRNDADKNKVSVVDFGPLTANDNFTTYGIACNHVGADGTVKEIDVRINGNPNEVKFFESDRIPWACSGLVDLEGLMTHERGHSFGLAHVREDKHGRLTMSKYFNGSCQRSERTLGKGDVIGLRKIYK